VKSTLTIKPAGFNIKVRRRPGKDWMVGIPGAPSSALVNEQPASKLAVASTESKGSKTFLRIVYGSNSGTCKALAEDLQTTAINRAGYNATLETMDHTTEHLPTDGTPVIFITPSYEGMPPDNAKKFVSWLEMNAVDGKENLKGLKYAVFGAGNSEWVRTFHRVPKLVDELGSKLGGSRICHPGFVDVREDVTGPWEDWTAQLWPALSKLTGTEQKLEEEQLKVTAGKPEHVSKLAGEEISQGFVKKNEVLVTDEVGPSKRHMEVELPEGMTYRTGKQGHLLISFKG
jgi:cytochrome P450/NADPH-cytochrome P450 reductase